ncbi:DUF4225 domain-containing protein [Vibrio algivorus]|uniref:DUF4225 domain-containing protein n=1 Tax=Vibrio algivorus TaxID=1667024 RepID=A0A557NT33_9VIBR|nr:DUF4225 domain-containing protein [Vibrio algivorus]TVO31581.1 DUF4225 domain-containing protein [Vibrio algivorus]
MVKKEPDYYDQGVVRKASKDVTMQASIVGSRHIKSGVYRARFIKDVDNWGQCLVNDFNQGKKSKEEVLSAFKKEKRNLMEQATLISTKGIGFIAGTMMVIGSAATCYASAATLCAFAAPVLAHGMNNMYENGKYFWDGDENATGWVRQGYQEAAKAVGFDKKYGDVAYYSADLFMSAKGVFGVSNTLKPLNEARQLSSFKPITPINIHAPLRPNYSWTKYAKAKQFKLFRYSTEDYLKGYQAASKVSLGTEAASDGLTLNSIYQEVRHDN